MADARSSLPTGPFLLRAKGKEARIPTLAAVRRKIASEFAKCDVVVIDLASGRRIIFKELATPGGGEGSSVSAPAHDRPGFFLSAATELEVVPADDVVIDPPAPPTPRPVTTKQTRARTTDYARPISPLPPRPSAPPRKGNPALMWISATVAGLLVVIVLLVVITGGRRKPVEAHGGVPAPTATEPHAATPAEAPRSADPGAVAFKPAPPVALEPAPLGGPGLVAHYRFDDAAHLGKDSSGHHRDAISSDGATIGFDPVLKRPVLILLGHSEVRLARTIARDFTMTVWINSLTPGTPLHDTPGQQWYSGLGLLDADVPGTRADFGSSILNGRFAFGIGDPDTTLHSSSIVADGHWHFLAVKRANSGRLQLYVDALEETSGDCPAGERSAPATMVVGRLMSGESYLIARLSSLRLYDRLLNDQEILDLLHGEGATP
jgi:hypothetical protein